SLYHHSDETAMGSYMDGILTQNGQFSTKKWLQKIAGVGLPSRLGQSDAVHLLTRMFFGTKSRTVPISHRRLQRAIHPSA
ncbi:hypothetical protein ACF1DY_38410, partial [Streptomyces albus]